MAAFKILDCVHWEFQCITAIHEKLRQIRTCLEVQSLNLDFFFFAVMFAYGNYNTYIGSSNAISQIFENILEIPLTIIKQTCLNHNISREPVVSWSSLCLKSAGQQHNSNERSYKWRYKKKKANSGKND